MNELPDETTEFISEVCKEKGCSTVLLYMVGLKNSFFFWNRESRA